MACCYLYLHSIGNVLVMLIPTDLSIPKFLLRSDAERKEMDDKRASERASGKGDEPVFRSGINSPQRRRRRKMGAHSEQDPRNVPRAAT